MYFVKAKAVTKWELLVVVVTVDVVVIIMIHKMEYVILVNCNIII